MAGEYVTVTRYIEWRLTLATEIKFKELMHEFDFIEEDSDEYYALEEQIRALPNFPLYSSETDYKHRVITDVWN